MELKKIIPPAKPEAPDWVPSPTPECPHLWKNRKTGLLENRAPTPPPQYTFAPYQGPVYIDHTYPDWTSPLKAAFVDLGINPALLTMSDEELEKWFMAGDSV